MGFAALKQTAQTICRLEEFLSGVDKEYVVQFAFRTEDGELTNKLIDELIHPGADKEAVYQKFSAMTDFQPDWIRSIENLLVSLELYRIQEEKALKILEEILSAYGIELSEEEIRKPAPERIREYTDRAESVQR